MILNATVYMGWVFFFFFCSSIIAAKRNWLCAAARTGPAGKQMKREMGRYIMCAANRACNEVLL